MPSIFPRAAFSSSSTTSPFTGALRSGATAPPNGVRGFFLIEQDSDRSIFANVQATVTGGNTITVNVIEQTTDGGGGLPTFVGDVNIFSSLPITQYSASQNNGRDGVLIVGDGNAVGNNGTTLSTNGWNEVLDSVSADILMYRKSNTMINADHTSTSTGTDLIDTFTVAEEPLVHTENVGGFPPANSVGFGLPFAKEYFYRQPGARQTVLLCAGDTGTSFDGGEWTQTTGANYLHAQLIANEFLAENAQNRISAIVISLGLADSVASAQAGFQAALDALINKLRSDAFTGNTGQTDFSKIPVVVCGLPNAFITANGAAATAIDASLADTPNRLELTGFADPEAGFTVDASNQYWEATAQRTMGELIYVAFINAFTNLTL